MNKASCHYSEWIYCFIHCVREVNSSPIIKAALFISSSTINLLAGNVGSFLHKWMIDEQKRRSDGGDDDFLVVATKKTATSENFPTFLPCY
jgi:hypothetical protein